MQSVSERGALEGRPKDSMQSVSERGALRTLCRVCQRGVP